MGLDRHTSTAGEVGGDPRVEKVGDTGPPDGPAGPCLQELTSGERDGVCFLTGGMYGVQIFFLEQERESGGESVEEGRAFASSSRGGGGGVASGSPARWAQLSAVHAARARGGNLKQLLRAAPPSSEPSSRGAKGRQP